MISKKMVSYVESSSIIRAMFEEGKRLSDIHGAENVYDFSLGNPNTQPPQAVKEAILDILNSESPTFVHGYMNNSGYEDVRDSIAKSINNKFNTDFNEKNIIMTVGAAGGINVILKTLLDPGDEVIAFAPFFGEYRSYTSNFDGNLIVVSPNTKDFQPNLEEFKNKITAKTKAVIINSPNNPTGVIYSEKTIIDMANILREKQLEFGADIYIIADEPYRELAYDGINVPYVTKYYDNTIVGYSYSKSLSLPGERIGYLVIPNKVADFENVVSAANVANRILGFVNAPSLIQRAVAKCVDAEVDIDSYNKNREALYNGLVSLGYECIKPEGAFYLFLKSPVEDDKLFCEMAKKYNILMVPGTSFACPGYVRIAYCVAYDTIINSLPNFKELISEVKDK
ncbi:pyridoxal phosphate-dependent aminotransferase [Anaerovorax odorimutans]|uniref:pyridoxal phosphate-dependent aminotransferase n=1 Tax=Anaerovorax odorimutans TaxID=109327 RepID=UPI00040021B4|nr:pyridoxal phosphate-dependent aminotransferase [Anaerovorax odorimutans]